MPQLSPSQMAEFMAKVKRANPGFRESGSSLRYLLPLLRKDSTTPEIAKAIKDISRPKQDQYKEALTLLKSTLGLTQAMFFGQLATDAAAAFQSREAKVQSKYLTKKIEQTQNGKKFEWDVMLTFDDYPNAILVKPVIRYQAKPNDPHAHVPTSAEQSNWNIQIKSAWKAVFLVDNKTKKDVSFDIEFVDENTAGNAYDIDVVDIPVHEAQKQELVRQGKMPATDNLQNQNWKVKQQAADLTLYGSSLGTPHLGQWGVRDKQAVVHEFGHAIGNPDEYLVDSHNLGTLGGHLVSYKDQPFTTPSIMNNTRQGRIFKRHFAVVADLYKQWKTAPGYNPSVSVLSP